MRKLIVPIVMSAVLMLQTSCVFENTMSYPKIFAGFTAFEVANASEVNIDNNKQNVSIILDEIAELSAVKVERYTLTDHAVLERDSIETLDLTDTNFVNLYTYQNYIWSISAQQPVERYVVVKDQIGDAEFNLEEKCAIVYVPETADLNNIVFLKAKFERKGSKILSTKGSRKEGESIVTEEQPVHFPMTLPSVMPREFKVSFQGEEIIWTVKVMARPTELKVSDVCAWCYHADIQALYSGVGQPSLEYREFRNADDYQEEWIPFDDVKVSGIGISASIKGLYPSTKYEVRVVYEGEYSEPYSFVTDTPAQLPNSSFEEWHIRDKYTWYPYKENEIESRKVWDSANAGSAPLLKYSITEPDKTTSYKGTAVKMTSKHAVIAFAAGSIYTGRFNKVDGIGADLFWGVPFTSRPTKLTGFYKYSPKVINRSDKAHADKIGTPDKAQFQILLTDWDKPFNVITSKNQFFDIPNDPSIIGYGVAIYGEETDGFQPFEVEVEYFDTKRQPTYITVTCCASYLGDFFTGGEDSTLWVDELELQYD